jgi:hypothetical protein
MFATRKKNRVIAVAPSAPPGGLALENSKIEPTPDNSTTPATTAVAATLFADAKQYDAAPQDIETFKQDIKALLQFTAKRELNILIVEDGKDFANANQDTLYLRKNDKTDIEYLFIKPGQKKISSGVLLTRDLWNYTVPGLLDNVTLRPLLPKILEVIYNREKYRPPLKAKWIASNNYRLILGKSTFIEEWCGNREWTKPLSPLQYAAWAGDTELSNDYLKLLPADLKAEALQQLKDVRNDLLERKHLSAINDLIKVQEKHRQIYAQYRYEGNFLENCAKEIRKQQFHSTVTLLQWFCSDDQGGKSEAQLMSGLNLAVLDPHGFGNAWGLKRLYYPRFMLPGYTSTVTYDTSQSPGVEVCGMNFHYNPLTDFYLSKKWDIVAQINQLESELKPRSSNRSSCLVM